MSLKTNKRLLKQLIEVIDSNKVGPKNRKFYGRPFMMFPWSVDSEWMFRLDDDFYEKTDKSFINLFNVWDYTFVEIATLLELVYVHKILD